VNFDSFQEFMKSFSKIEPLSNFQIIEKCKELKIRNFKGVFMRNELNDLDINTVASENECLVLNIDHSSNNGTHWVCLFIKNKVCYYFDSYGFPAPIEIEKYLHKYNLRYYNSFEIQNLNQVICGHFCIYVLLMLNNGVSFEKTLDKIYKYNN